tara:strand:- start:974 stop:1519 length:546 start_codon:yes stop_codon:yes gene_type:complete
LDRAYQGPIFIDTRKKLHKNTKAYIFIVFFMVFPLFYGCSNGLEQINIDTDNAEENSPSIKKVDLDLESDDKVEFFNSMSSAIDSKNNEIRSETKSTENEDIILEYITELKQDESTSGLSFYETICSNRTCSVRFTINSIADAVVIKRSAQAGMRMGLWSGYSILPEDSTETSGYIFLDMN